jgi:hypothetical protein
VEKSPVPSTLQIRTSTLLYLSCGMLLLLLALLALL